MFTGDPICKLMDGNVFGSLECPSVMPDGGLRYMASFIRGNMFQPRPQPKVEKKASEAATFARCYPRSRMKHKKAGGKIIPTAVQVGQRKTNPS